MSRATHDSREGGGRAKQDARAEDAVAEQSAIRQEQHRHPGKLKGKSMLEGVFPTFSPFIVMLCVAYFVAIMLFTPAYCYQKYQYLKNVQKEKERRKRDEKNFQRALKYMERIDEGDTAFLDDITEDESQK